MEPTRPLREGTVTRLEVQRKNQNRVSVFLDGEFAFGLYADVAVRHRVEKGRLLTAEEQQLLLAADGLLLAKAAALEFLAYRARTEFEIRQKLLRIGHAEEVADRVVGELRDAGYLDDAEYARAYVRGRLAGRGYGPERIRQELGRRGVARASIDAALDELAPEADALDAARAQAARRWSRLSGEPDPRKRRKKLYDFLLRRGFDYDTARRVAEELEAGE